MTHRRTREKISKAEHASKSPPQLPGHRAGLYKPLKPPTLFSSPSQCKGFTRISEDSSEIAFLLVENYTKTAHFGPSGIGMEFLDQ